MRIARRLGTLVLGSIALVAVGCYAPASGEPAAVSSVDPGTVATATPVLILPAPVILSVDTPTPGPVRVTPAPTATAVVASTELEPVATSTPTELPDTTPTAAPTVTATPTGSLTPVPAAAGSPFTNSDLVAAIVAHGFSYSPRDQRVGCAGRAPEVRTLDGPDGPPLTLWVYATSDELKADWVLPSSGAPRPTIAGCEVGSGWIYWYENLVMAFEPQDEWIPESATRNAIVQAFFSLTR